MPSDFNPRIHPDCLKRDRTVAFRDPFGYQLDTYGTKPAHDLEDFVAYCFALSHDRAVDAANRAPGGVDEVHALRESLVVVLISLLAGYSAGEIADDGFVCLNNAVTVGDCDNGPWTELTWSVDALRPDEVVFLLAVQDDDAGDGLPAPTLHRVLLARAALDPLEARWNSVAPLFEHYFHLNKLVTSARKLRELSAWHGEQDLHAVETVLHVIWRSSIDPHGDVNLLSQQVQLFAEIQGSARGGALARALSGRK